MLSAIVAFMVNDTREASCAPSNPATAERASNTAMLAANAAACDPRPGPPNEPIASATARATPSGFLSVVAALSR